MILLFAINLQRLIIDDGAEEPGYVNLDTTLEENVHDGAEVILDADYVLR